VAGALDINGQASGGKRYSRAHEFSGTFEVAGTLDINGQAAGNAAGRWSRDGNGRAPELFRTVDTTGALDINGRVEGHGRHVRPAQPLGHSTSTPAFGATVRRES
jgi:hypothetical protein